MNIQKRKNSINMECELKVNTNLYGFKGIIGRRDYFLNGVIIASIYLFFLLPYQLWLFSHIQTMPDLLRLDKMFVQAHILLKLWILFGIAGTFVLSASNIYRRLNDINGKINIYLNIFVLFIFLIFNLCLILPLGISVLFGLIGFIIGLIILFKRGKITGEYPYDYTKEFNWGAYIGTWIWGLFNKSYKTLWMLLLGFTPWGAYFQLYCGLKGNEWAFKNKKCCDVEAFNKSQEKQSAIFAVLFFVVMPTLYFIVIFAVVSMFMFSTFDDMKNNPEKAEQTMATLEDTMSKFGSLYFDSHLITPDENKYYLSSSDWNSYSFKEKKDILDLAASLASTEREKEYNKLNPKNFKSFSKAGELPRTKIYSTETKKLLGEFLVDESSLEKGSFKEFLKISMKAYRFYNE